MILKKMVLIAALLGSSYSHATLVLNGGFEAPDLDTLASNTPYLIRGSQVGLSGNVLLGLPGGSSIAGWWTEGTRADLINNNIGSSPILGAVWPTAYEGNQYLYLNASGNNSTSLYQMLSLTGGSVYSLGFYLNGLTGASPVFDALPYQPQVSVSILDASMSLVFQALATGTTNTGWTEIDLNFSIPTSGTYRLVFSTPTNPALPAGQRQNFIALDQIALIDVPVAPPPEEPTQPVPAPATLWCVLAGLLGMRAIQGKKAQSKRIGHSRS